MSVMCPHCHEQKPAGARVCSKCTREITPGDQAAHNVLIILIWIVAIVGFFALTSAKTKPPTAPAAT